MDLTAVRQLYDLDERIQTNVPGYRRETDGSIVRLIRSTENEGLSFVIYSHLQPENAQEAIDDQIAYFQALGHSFEWKAYAHDRPQNLARLLADSGFSVEEPEAVMVLSLQAADARLLVPVDADVRRILNPAAIKQIVAIMEDVWGGDFDWLLARLTGYLRDFPDYASIYLAYAGEKPVCAGWTFFPPGSRFASLWGGSTRPDYRGQGFYSAVLAARVQEAIARGYQYITIDAGPMSRPIVERRGFKPLAEAYECQWCLEG